MNSLISSEQLRRPLLVKLLHKIDSCLKEIDQEFFVIGATARDLIISQLPGIQPSRSTRDLDLAIAIPNWSAFDRITEVLLAHGLTKDLQRKQRFYDGVYELDLVPYGAVAKEDDQIYWPPEEDIAMSVRGFAEVLSEAITVSIDGELEVKVASLHGLFLLKLSAWEDRHLETRKDADDMEFIIRHYFLANYTRDFHPEVYDWTDFDEWGAGAYWLAYDAQRLLPSQHLAHYAQLLASECHLAEGSPLIQQLLEASPSLSFAQAHAGLLRIVNVWTATASGLC